MAFSRLQLCDSCCDMKNYIHGRDLKHKSDCHAGAECHTYTLHSSPTEVYAVSGAGDFPPYRGASAWMSTPQTSLFLKS